MVNGYDLSFSNLGEVLGSLLFICDVYWLGCFVFLQVGLFYWVVLFYWFRVGLGSV